MDRRQLLGSALALPWLPSACGAQRTGGGDVIAAGNPAALLIHALAPARLAGWPKRPSRSALRLLSPAADLPELGALNASAAPADPEALAARRPAFVLDYGDVAGTSARLGARFAARLALPYHLLDGTLAATPRTMLAADKLLGTDNLALHDLAAATLRRWAKPAGAGPSFYYARGADALETGFAGALATEVLEGAGWTNVAGGTRPTIGRVALEQVVAWDPELVVTLDPGFAAQAQAAATWRRRRGGGRRRLLLLPALPFGWIDRPPSLNRLIGCAWLGGGAKAAQAMSAALYRTSLPARPELLPQWLD